MLRYAPLARVLQLQKYFLFDLNDYVLWWDAMSLLAYMCSMLMSEGKANQY